MKRTIILAAILLLTSCDAPQQSQPLALPPPAATNNQPAVTSPPAAPAGQSLTDHMITSAVGGAAAGVGAAVAHQAANGMVNKWKTYSRARRINRIRSRRR